MKIRKDGDSNVSRFWHLESWLSQSKELSLIEIDNRHTMYIGCTCCLFDNCMYFSLHAVYFGKKDTI